MVPLRIATLYSSQPYWRSNALWVRNDNWITTTTILTRVSKLKWQLV